MLEKEKVENERQKMVTKESVLSKQKDQDKEGNLEHGFEEQGKEDRVVRHSESKAENEEVTKKLELEARINTEEVVERESVGESKKGKVGEENGKDKEEAAESIETLNKLDQKKYSGISKRVEETRTKLEEIQSKALRVPNLPYNREDEKEALT
ncbi:RNA-binding protein 25-like [Impatiens glandulifera]|uniref:RNA-binding protein 25-like n=1 Tax=Impatiens glandulifera TaxID=253017 RepID=UPI001FB16970|nr:RNA-binding protein 25-like [Impatiens glandulifera]